MAFLYLVKCQIGKYEVIFSKSVFSSHDLKLPQHSFPISYKDNLDVIWKLIETVVFLGMYKTIKKVILELQSLCCAGSHNVSYIFLPWETYPEFYKWGVAERGSKNIRVPTGHGCIWLLYMSISSMEVTGGICPPYNLWPAITKWA